MRVIKVISDDLNQLGFITPEGEHYYPYKTVDELYDAIRSIYGLDDAYTMIWNKLGDTLHIYSFEERMK